MRAATSPSSGKPYGMARVCRVWGTSQATVYRRSVTLRCRQRIEREPQASESRLMGLVLRTACIGCPIQQLCV